MHVACWLHTRNLLSQYCMKITPRPHSRVKFLSKFIHTPSLFFGFTTEILSFWATFLFYTYHSFADTTFWSHYGPRQMAGG